MKRCLNCMEEYNDSLGSCPLCGYSPGRKREPDFLLKEGVILQRRYIVGTCQGMRSCDITYIGWDALFERKVLIQEFFPSGFVKRSQGLAVMPKEELKEPYEKSLNRFIRYFRKLIRLYKEDDIGEVYSCFSENGTAYATQQYSAAATLREWLEIKRGKAPSEAVAFLQQAVRALEKVHGLGLVHGDVGLDSFWLTGTGKLVLKGFWGPCYFSGEPGMEAFKELEPWEDVYGLALMLGSFLTAEPDMKPENLIKRLERRQGEIPGRMVEAIGGALDLDGFERIDTLKEFYDSMFSDSETIEQLSDWEGDNFAPGSIEVFPKKAVDSWRHSGGRLKLVLCLVLVLVMVAAGVFAYKRLGPQRGQNQEETVWEATESGGEVQ